VSKRVVFLSDSISTQRAGIHYYGRQLIDSIMETYPEYEYFSISSSKIPNVGLDQVIVPISKYIPFHLRWRQVLSIPTQVKKLNPDIVIELAHFGPFNLPDHIDRITVIHDLSAITHKRFHSLLSHIVQKISLARIVKKSKYVISNSYFTKREIRKWSDISESKIKVLYPKILAQKEIHSGQVGFPFKDELYFLCVGTIEPRKNYETVIRAFERLYEIDKSPHLVIVGMAGWKHDTFDSLYKKSPAKDHIHLTGYVSEIELDHIYKGALAFISASHFEGFGLPILEAAIQSLPLIVADNSSQKEIVGQRGLLFSASDVDHLRSHMESVLTSSELQQKLQVQSIDLVKSLEAQRQEQFESLGL